MFTSSGPKAVVCLALAALLGLTACTSDDGDPGGDQTPSAQARAAQSQPVPSPSATGATTTSAAPSPDDAAGAPSSTPCSIWPDLPETHGAWRDKPKGPYAPDAEAIHTKAGEMLNRMEETYGSAQGAKCWPERPTMWTDACALGVTKAEAAARQSLEWIRHEPAATFPTLRANAALVSKAALTYRTTACASDPQGAKARATCQAAAYTVAQAYIYLRDGFNAALQSR